jgi:hypothetical protein
MTLAKVAKINEREMGGNGLNFVASPPAHRTEKLRQEHHELRLDAICAVYSPAFGHSVLEHCSPHERENNATCTRDTNMSPSQNRKRRVLSRMESQVSFKPVLASRRWLKFMIRKRNNERKKRKLFCGSEKSLRLAFRIGFLMGQINRTWHAICYKTKTFWTRHKLVIT